MNSDTTTNLPHLTAFVGALGGSMPNPQPSNSPTPMKRRAGMDGLTRGGSGNLRAMRRNMKRRKEVGR